MTGYKTVQMSDGAPGGSRTIHLAGPGQHGGTGNNACGLDRHARGPGGEHLYGFSVGGGWTDPHARPCRGCLRVLEAAPGPVSGIFAHLFPPAAEQAS